MNVFRVPVEQAIRGKLWDMQMQGGLKLYLIHIAGERMIQTGIDALSRGDENQGIMQGMHILDFIPLHLSPTERESPK